MLDYATPGGLVVTGRDQYNDPIFQEISAGGGTVLIYLDCIINDAFGTYASLLMNSSIYGPAVPLWPPGYEVNIAAGYFLNDFRIGGILQNKLHGVLEQMVSDNPFMAGFFLDDLGSRSFYPDLNWSTFPDQQGYRDGAIAIAQTARQVADKHRLMVLVNGSWNANDGGGYPNVAQHGLSLAEGGYVEHHDGQIAFFGPYAASPQWAAASTVTKGVSYCWAAMNTTAGVTEFVNSGDYAYVNYQPTASYGGVTPFGPPLVPNYYTGLPSHAS
jgi:hypothetical protein